MGDETLSKYPPWDLDSPLGQALKELIDEQCVHYDPITKTLRLTEAGRADLMVREKGGQ